MSQTFREESSEHVGELMSYAIEDVEVSMTTLAGLLDTLLAIEAYCHAAGDDAGDDDAEGLFYQAETVRDVLERLFMCFVDPTDLVFT